MSEQYNSEVSKHYAAYRPPLHSMILSDMLAGQSKFKTGLDIGSGTGVSSIALSEFCEEVIGIEPSKAMLEKATPQESIRYLEGSGEHIPLEDLAVDLVSFAGSLFYDNSDALIEELTRVCRPNTLVAIYDFDVILTSLMALLGVAAQKGDADYNHAENSEGRNALKALKAHRGEIQLTVTPGELDDGRVYVLKPGMSYQVADKAEAHRSSTKIGETLFVVTDMHNSNIPTPSQNMPSERVGRPKHTKNQ